MTVGLKVKPSPFRSLGEFRITLVCEDAGIRFRVLHIILNKLESYLGSGDELMSISMMHSVHDGISSWTEIRRALEEKRKDIEEPFPTFIHRKHPVCSITMMKESLREKRQIPMSA
jgi:hypothetical protein